MESIKLELAGISDAAAILDIYRYYIENTVVTFEVETPALHDFEKRVESISSVYPYIICRKQGALLAYAYSGRQMERAAYKWNATASIYVDRNYVGRGLGTVLYRVLIDILRLQNVHNLYAGVTSTNPASEKLHLKLGFRKLGVYSGTGFKFGKWHDVTWFEKRIVKGDGQPGPLLPITEIDPARVSAILADHAKALQAGFFS